MTKVHENLREVRARIERACDRCGRTPDEVALVAVSKTRPVDVLAEAVAAGVLDLGENRAQELHQKAQVMDGSTVRWHFIGHLQSNKVRQVVGVATLIHSVDRYGVAEAVAKRAVANGFVQDVLIEVNVSGEATKHGVEPARCISLATELSRLEGLNVRGLMTMAPMANDPEDSRGFFAALRELGTDLAGRLPRATELSMGMTRDFEVAIEEGATLVRVGEAIFGPRPATN